MNFLVLGIAVLGLAHVVEQRGRIWQRPFWLAVAQQLVAPAVVFLWALPWLLEAARGPVAEALPILFDVRAPHHFQPTLAVVAPFFAWQAAAWLVVASRARERTAIAHMSLLAGMGGLVMVASLLTTTVFVPTIAQLFPWRLAPFATLLAFLLVVSAGLRAALHGAHPREWAALAAAGALSVYGTNVAFARETEARLFVIALAVVVATTVARRIGRHRVVAFAGVAVVSVIAAGIVLRDFEPEIERSPRRLRDLAAWAADKTAKDALFLVPPDLVEFRLIVKRSIVVDWKSAGMLPKDVVAWSERIADVSGALSARHHVRDGYARMSAEHARAIAQKYGASYVVFDKREHAAPPRRT